ncbi:cytochrome C552 [Acuticoccus sediminis]|uniref:Cytochrome C552 n=1 Tax=Acuticoccus sediminis TaxID=2184697 RepID=A0A8B2NV08_9HYPH|nr:cytochrome C552 [Acuticoccus sediminis]
MAGLFLTAVTLGAVSAGTPASAQDRAARGKALAETWCVRCHAIGEPQPSALSDAPSFEALASQPGFGSKHLANVLVAPHPVMPEFPLTNDDLAALEAYMQSLTAAK